MMGKYWSIVVAHSITEIVCVRMGFSLPLHHSLSLSIFASFSLHVCLPFPRSSLTLLLPFLAQFLWSPRFALYRWVFLPLFPSLDCFFRSLLFWFVHTHTRAQAQPAEWDASIVCAAFISTAECQSSGFYMVQNKWFSNLRVSSIQILYMLYAAENGQKENNIIGGSMEKLFPQRTVIIFIVQCFSSSRARRNPLLAVSFVPHAVCASFAVFFSCVFVCVSSLSTFVTGRCVVHHHISQSHVHGYENCGT